MSAGTTKLLVAGLPSAGKTTFLAALWNCVTDSRVTGALQVRSLDGDRIYLDQIRDAWLECSPVGRTPPSGSAHVRMELTDGEGLDLTLDFPDLSGETYERQWSKRQVSLEYERLVQDVSGALLFLHPFHVQEPTSIEEARLVVAGAGSVPETDTTDVQPVSWRPELAPTEVQLVDVLQALAACRREKPLPLITLVSAWDLLRGQRTTPDAWIRSRVPLLHQFLSANAACFPSKYAGVSAQGGSNDDEAGRLELAKAEPRNRIQLVDGNQISNDITLPIRWLADSKRWQR